MRKFEIICKEELDKYQELFEKENVILPKRQTVKASGYDFYSPYKVSIKANSIALIYTGVKVELNDDEYLSVYIRSSIAIKRGLTMANQVGIIDSDYYNNNSNDGHIIIAIRNNNNFDAVIEKGERFAQGIICKYYLMDDDEVTNTRDGGIGSTNKL